MKLFFVILLIYINYVICSDHKYAVKRYPKKVKPLSSGKIIINSGKYVPKKKDASKDGYTSKDNIYTAFQSSANTKASYTVPESLYFPDHHSFAPKPRVKKVLSDELIVWSRQKRSLDKTKKEEKPKQSGNKTEAKIHKAKNSTDHNTNVKLSAHDNHNPKDKHKGNQARKTEVARNNKSVNKNTTKTSITKEVGNTTSPKLLRKGKSNAAGRARSKKTKSKTRSRGKPKNGTSSKRSKSSSKRQGRKKKQSKKKSPLRHKKGNQTTHPKAKHRARKGNTTILSKTNETRRLTSAQEALIEDYPYVVSIQKNSEHWCSGALLNPRVVITTANCLWKSNRISRMSIRAGSSFTDRGGQVAKIQEVMKHPRWGLRRNPDNDLALILLDRNIKFSHTCHGVDLPNRVMQPAFLDAWVASWGAERRDGVFDTHEKSLQVVHSYLLSNETCNNITKRFGVTVSENFLCFSQAGKTAPCTRDTGAPAVSDGILWGVASWGLRKLCGTERFPAMFSYTASHSNMDFITNATTYLMSEKRYHPFLDRQPGLKRNNKPKEKPNE